MNLAMTERPLLLYVADPMCSWCWGFAPVLESLRTAFPDLPHQLVLGGLAADSDAPMEPSMSAFVQHAWREVHERTGAAFNFDFWQECQPRRSTWPACRAVILARRQELGGAMFRAIQEAYYLHARNPSDDSTLADLAAQLGLARGPFLDQLHAAATQQELDTDFELRRRLGANSFPSLGLLQNGQPSLLHSGWCDAATAQALVAGALRE